MDFNEVRDTFARLDSAIDYAQLQKERLDSELFEYFCENRPRLRHKKNQKFYHIVGSYGAETLRGRNSLMIREVNQEVGFLQFTGRELIENFEILS